MASEEQRKVSRLASGATVTGEMTVEGNLHIEATVEGEVRAGGQVLVAEEGAVDGDIAASRIGVAGRVTGTLHADDSIMIENGAVVDGALVAPVATIEEGACVEGELRIGIGVDVSFSGEGTEAART